jgi:uncharacterized protein (TIGR03067 family)
MHALLVAAIGVTVAAEPEAEDVNKELKKFNGTWVILSAEVSGRKQPPDTLKGLELTFKGDKVTFKTPKGNWEGTMTVDPNANPKQYEATATSPDGKKITSYGVYEFKDDTLRLCYVIGNKDKRPKEFKTKEGTMTSLIVYQRKKS